MNYTLVNFHLTRISFNNPPKGVIMPIIKSALKKMRKDKKRTVSNLLFKKKLKSALKKAYKGENAVAAISLIDKAVKKNIIKLNKGSRLKTKISKANRKPKK